MILFTLLTLTLLTLLGIAVAMVTLFGAGILIVFGDVFVFIFIAIWLIKKLFFKKK